MSNIIEFKDKLKHEWVAAHELCFLDGVFGKWSLCQNNEDIYLVNVRYSESEVNIGVFMGGDVLRYMNWFMNDETDDEQLQHYFDCAYTAWQYEVGISTNP